MGPRETLGTATMPGVPAALPEGHRSAKAARLMKRVLAFDLLRLRRHGEPALAAIAPRGSAATGFRPRASRRSAQAENDAVSHDGG